MDSSKDKCYPGEKNIYKIYKQPHGLYPEYLRSFYKVNMDQQKNKQGICTNYRRHENG